MVRAGIVTPSTEGATAAPSGVTRRAVLRGLGAAGAGVVAGILTAAPTRAAASDDVRQAIVFLIP